MVIHSNVNNYLYKMIQLQGSCLGFIQSFRINRSVKILFEIHRLQLAELMYISISNDFHTVSKCFIDISITSNIDLTFVTLREQRIYFRNHRVLNSCLLQCNPQIKMQRKSLVTVTIQWNKVRIRFGNVVHHRNNC